ncbi:GNAT family N-acetyltransferase [bacterium]|nr:GNAT family N-acetyltransferase [bacterium]MBP9809347.1 GNAT family N-acetyltransferase [bacterium]
MFNGNHEYAAKDRLKDGTAVIVRAIRASDKDLLQQLMKDVSAESRYFRFFCAKKLLTSQELKYFTEIDFDSHIGLIVSLCDESETPIAVGRYITQTGDEGTGGAELALLVGEEYQRQGLGNILLDHLAQIAITKGVSEFVCYIMPENSKMLSFLRHSKYPVNRLKRSSSVISMTVDLSSEHKSA